MLTIHPSTQKLEPLHTHPTQIYALRIFGTFMAFNLISIMFTLEANTFMLYESLVSAWWSFIIGILCFMRTHLLIMQELKIAHHFTRMICWTALKTSTIVLFAFSHSPIHTNNYTRQSLLPFAEPCRRKNFLFYFCFVIPATLYQLLNISSHITTIMAARAFNHFSCWERFHCYVFLNNHENSFWAFLYCYLHFVVSSFTLHSLRNEKPLIVRIISI